MEKKKKCWKKKKLKTICAPERKKERKTEMDGVEKRNCTAEVGKKETVTVCACAYRGKKFASNMQTMHIYMYLSLHDINYDCV